LKKNILFLFFFSSIFAQIGDLGPTLVNYPELSVRDSLPFIIYEGGTSFQQFFMEGGALEIEGGAITDVIFSFTSEAGQQKIIQGKLFSSESQGTTLATFIIEKSELTDQFSFKIISTESVNVKSVIGFIPESIIATGTERILIPAGGDVPKPLIVTREEWNSQPPKYTYTNHPYIDKLTLHHAACCSAENLDEGKTQVLWIQDFHQNGRGWNDIGYHFLVDRAGNIYQGRPETVIGAHVGGANTGNIGVCLLGCYHPPEINCFQTMTEESREAIIKIFGWLSDTYGQHPSILLGHKDYFGTTACPGNNVWYELPGIRIDIADYIKSMEEIPPIYISRPAYPNPFSKQITFNLELKRIDNVSINIYDLLGRKVNTIEAIGVGPGSSSINWDGKNYLGKGLSNGVYFAQPAMGNNLDPIKIVLLKK